LRFFPFFPPRGPPGTLLALCLRKGGDDFCLGYRDSVPPLSLHRKTRGLSVMAYLQPERARILLQLLLVLFICSAAEILELSPCTSLSLKPFLPPSARVSLSVLSEIELLLSLPFPPAPLERVCVGGAFGPNVSFTF